MTTKPMKTMIAPGRIGHYMKTHVPQPVISTPTLSNRAHPRIIANQRHAKINLPLKKGKKKRIPQSNTQNQVHEKDSRAGQPQSLPPSASLSQAPQKISLSRFPLRLPLRQNPHKNLDLTRIGLDILPPILKPGTSRHSEERATIGRKV